MFSFALACFSLYVSFKAFQFGYDKIYDYKERKKEEELLTKTAAEKKLKEESIVSKKKSKYYRFLTDNDSTNIFIESKKMFDKAIEEALKDEKFGSAGHNVTLVKELHNYQIKLNISPTHFSWEVRDSSQPDTYKSHLMYKIQFERSRQLITHDELRINEGEKYSHDSILKYENFDIFPFSFLESFKTLNHAGWNKPYDTPKITKENKVISVLENDMQPSMEKIQNVLHEYAGKIDTEVLKSLESILQLVQKIVSNEETNQLYVENKDIEMKHNLERLLNTELWQIIQMYVRLDEKNKASANKIVIGSLEKAHHSLLEKYTALQTNHLNELKKVQLIMEQRYE